MSERYLYPADILLPAKDFESFAVIACDQFTSNREYWSEVEKKVGDRPSALRLTLPEIYLPDEPERRTAEINGNMREYLEGGILEEYPGAMIYVERTQRDGRVRRGIIGAVDLEKYDYRKGSKTLIRATEETVPDRLPPRVKIREGACLELPHILMLIDDPANRVISEVSERRGDLKKLYDFELMMGGGHIRGYLLGDDLIDKVNNALSSLVSGDHPLLFAVGDGNHSLAAAKECYLKDPNELNRYALVEVENIHDGALDFEPIYRVLFGLPSDTVIRELEEFAGSLDYPGGQKITLLCRSGERNISLKPTSKLTVGTVQNFVNHMLKKYAGLSVDYIHEPETVRELSKNPDTVGFIFEGMKKSELFGAVIGDGALPRKTFSMGEGVDKRYYIEARRIK